jgi:hypothetical protein
MVQRHISKAGGLLLALCSAGFGQLNQNCTVAVLNRTVPVNSDGSWVLPNIPANFGQVKARATCIQNNQTIFGESAFFTVNANSAVNLPAITLGAVTQIPVSLTISSSVPSLTTVGQTAQLTVRATYPDGTTKDVTAASTGTNYTASNAAIASINANGLVTAVSSGTVVIQASNDGASGIITAPVVLGGSSHQGIPDSWALSYGLNPLDPTLAAEDPDHDGLTNLQEYMLGTSPVNPDTDGDGLTDGDEVNKYHTNPLLPDTDGDLIPDGVEVQTGTDPLNPKSYDLLKATLTSTVTPPSFSLKTSLANPVLSIQLDWKVTLIDGKTTLDLTADPRTTYKSSDLTICNFQMQAGDVFSGNNTGNCTITITQSTLSISVAGSVSGFAPTEVSTLVVPGAAAVDVGGNFAYVAAGSNGLVIVDINDRTKPFTRGQLSGLGNVDAVRVSGQIAFVADANGYIRVVQCQNPDAPTLAASLAVAGSPSALALHGTILAVAAQTGGVSLVNVSTPTTPTLLARFIAAASAVGIDFDPTTGLAAIAMGSAGLQIANLSNPASPVLRGILAGGDVLRVLVRSPAVLLADAQRSVSAVDATNPDHPVLTVSLASNLGGVPVDIAAFGNTAITADNTFGRAIPIVNISNPLNPSSVGFWTLLSPGYSSSVAMDLSFGYAIIPAIATLRILKYQNIVDTFGIPPTISITSPAAGTTLIQGQPLTVSANATDDVAVASVNFTVNGQPVFTTAASPFQFSYMVPMSATTLTFGATAVDYGNNVGIAANVVAPVIPDPLTTVKGRVLDTSGNPAAGANVSSEGKPGVTAVDGTFTLAGLSTIKGLIAVSASSTIGGIPLFGLSAAIAPVLGGVTNVGDIRLAPKPSISSIGPASLLAGTTVSLSVTGFNLAGSTFAFAPAGGIGVNSATVNATGMTATLNVSAVGTAVGRFTLIGTNPAGSSDPTAIVGFVKGSPPFNTISVPGSDPNADPDKDGLTNVQEITAGTDPLNGDTDGDTWPDGLEVLLKSDPLDPASIPHPQPAGGWLSSPLISMLNNANPGAGVKGSTQYVSSTVFSLLNSLNPGIGVPGSKQYVSGTIFSILNAQNPSVGTTGTKQYVSGTVFSILNSLNPGIGVTGSKQYVSGTIFSILNAQNPGAGITGTKQYVSSAVFSILNSLNPGIGVTGSKQYVSGPVFSLLNSMSPAPTMPYARFVNGPIFSISNTALSSNSVTRITGLFSGLLAEGTIAARTAQPWLYLAGSLHLLDSDGDGIPDEDELRLGTNPFDRDTDHDGYPDGLEIALGSNPLDPNSIPDIKGPGLSVSPVLSIQNLAPLAKQITPAPRQVALRRRQ